MDLKFSPKLLAAAHNDPQCAAEAADLKYVSDESTGLTRRKSGKGFAYYHADGEKITDKATVERINALAIPPAYTTFGSAPTRWATSKPPAATTAAASSTATTTAGPRSATPRSSAR